MFRITQIYLLLFILIYFVGYSCIGCLSFYHRAPIIAEGNSENSEQLISQQEASNSENCICVFHYLCDRNYNIKTGGDDIIDPRIGANDPPKTVCPPGQICCRPPSGVVITTLPPVTDPPSPPTVPPTPPPTVPPTPPPTPPPTAPPTTTQPTTVATTERQTEQLTTITPAPPITQATTPSSVPTITLPPGTVIILPTIPSTIPTVPPTAPPTTTTTITTNAPTEPPTNPPTEPPTNPPTEPPTTTPTPAPIPTAIPTEPPTPAPIPTAIPTEPPTTTTQAETSTAAIATTAASFPIVPSIIFPTTFLPPLPSTVLPPFVFTTLNIPTFKSTTPRLPNTYTKYPLVLPTLSLPSSLPPSITITNSDSFIPPIIFPTNPQNMFGTNLPSTLATMITTQATTMSPPVTTEAPNNQVTTIQPPIGPPGSQCGVQYISSSKQETIDPAIARFAEYPWMLAVLDTTAVAQDGTVIKNAFVCGASLIRNNIAVTAAHCIKNLNASNLIIRAGEWNTLYANEPLPHQDRSIAQIEIHEDFNRSTLYYDIALLRLDEPVVFANNVVPICQPTVGQEFVGSTCIATGWGKNAFGPPGKYQTKMRKVSLNIISKELCQTQLRATRLSEFFILNESFLCAGGEENQDTCTGDGGGPLACQIANGTWVQAGIVSWGIGCGQANVPGVYVDVSIVAGWIESKIRSLSMDKIPRFGPV